MKITTESGDAMLLTEIKSKPQPHILSRSQVRKPSHQTVLDLHNVSNTIRTINIIEAEQTEEQKLFFSLTEEKVKALLQTNELQSRLTVQKVNCV